MKIAFVVKSLDSRGGGAERVLAQISAWLAERGYEITVVTFDHAGTPDFYPIDERINRIWLAAGRPRSRTHLLDAVQRIRAIRREIRKLDPDVVVGFMHSAYVPLAFALTGTSIPLIASEHIVFDHYKPFPLEALSLRVTARRYRRITIISEAVRRTFPKTLASRMVVIPNPISEFPLPRADPVGASRAKILLSVGRLSPQKDHATLLRAFNQIASKHPDWRLRIIGEGILRPSLEALCRELGISDRIDLPGVSHDVESEYRRAQLFVMPSQYESFGLATAEALSAGLPVIGFADCPGTNELISNGLNGLLVNGADRVGALAEGLDKLMSSSALRISLAAAAPDSVERFALEPISRMWEKVLLE